MKPRILLVNPPIYDFSAYDFWLRPYGLLSVGGMLRNVAEVKLFDHLDRMHPQMADNARLRRDQWGRGEYCSTVIDRPPVFAEIPRRYRRYGLAQETFEEFLQRQGPFDAALIQTTMTYWYPGVAEVIAALRSVSPRTRERQNPAKPAAPRGE